MPPRRIKACDACRRRKTKCDVNTKSKCSHCEKSRIPCTLTEYRRRRTRANLMMINRLESNLDRMEARLQGLGFDPSVLDNELASPSPECEYLMDEDSRESDSRNLMPAGLDQGSSTTIAPVDTNPVVTAPYKELDSSLPETLTSFFVPRFLVDDKLAGCQAGFSTLLEEGKMSMDNEELDHGAFDGVFPNKVFCHLPPRDEMMSLLQDYLQTYNAWCPLFSVSKLSALFNHDKMNAMLHAPGRWTSINVVLAIGYMLRVKSRSAAQEDHQRSWLFIKNALGVLNELCLSPPDLWSIQGLLGMALFLLGTSSAQPCRFLISAAVRISQQLGLQRTEYESNLSPEDVEQRRRVFWISYCLDRDISLRYGMPLSQSDEDICVSLPMEAPSDSLGVVPTKDQQSFNAFRSCCQLALIKSQLYKYLYSASATDKSLDEIIAAVSMLDAELQQWKANIPPEFQPEARNLAFLSQRQMSVLVLFLHYSYFDSIILVHRLIATRAPKVWRDLSDGDTPSIVHTPPSNTRVYMSSTLCARAARASINLMKYIPERDISAIGMMIHYPIVALKTLSSSIVCNPREASRQYDLKLIGQVETFLSSLVLSTPNEGIRRLIKCCSEYRAIAEVAVKEAMQVFGA